MASYGGQVQRIRAILSSSQLREVSVLSPREIQGKEFRVVIISTVRSAPKKEDLEFDKKFDLGFINNPKAINTVMTRAMELLVVIGNSEALLEDRNWSEFISFCKESAGFEGGATNATFSFSETTKGGTSAAATQGNSNDKPPTPKPSPIGAKPAFQLSNGDQEAPKVFPPSTKGLPLPLSYPSPPQAGDFASAPLNHEAAVFHPPNGLVRPFNSSAHPAAIPYPAAISYPAASSYPTYHLNGHDNANLRPLPPVRPSVRPLWAQPYGNVPPRPLPQSVLPPPFQAMPPPSYIPASPSPASDVDGFESGYETVCEYRTQPLVQLKRSAHAKISNQPGILVQQVNGHLLVTINLFGYNPPTGIRRIGTHFVVDLTSDPRFGQMNRLFSNAPGRSFSSLLLL